MECARRPVPCPYECGGSYPEEEINEHKARGTALARYGADRGVSAHPAHICRRRCRHLQLKTCVKRMAKPITCPLKCGLKFTGTYDRVRDLEFEVAEHVRERCQERLISCDFNGCFDSMPARERRNHRAKHLRGAS